MVKAPRAQPPNASTVEPGQGAALGSVMAQVQAGNVEGYADLLTALRAILEVYAGRVLRRMGKYEPNLVEDRVQDILIAVHEKRHTYDAARPFMPWLFAIARYKLIDFGRREKRTPPSVAIETVESLLGSPVFEEPGSITDLTAIMARLPERSRKILELVKVEGLSVAEAAAEVHMTQSALKVAVHRAIKTLRSQIKEVP